MRGEGYLIIVDPAARSPIEAGTFCCTHCNKIVVVKPGSGIERGFCHNCHAPHCGGKKCWDCVPFERKLEEWEGRRQLWQSFRPAR